MRVGLVEDIEPFQHDDGTTSAKLDLKLDSDVEELPVDSTVIVRSRSALGLKYLEINKGTSSETFAPGRSCSRRRDPAPVEIDQVLNTNADPGGGSGEPGRSATRSRAAASSSTPRSAACRGWSTCSCP